MDRISALRNIEEALAAFEDGEASLPDLEREVRGILRTYATEFEAGAAYRASGPDRVDGLVVVADSPRRARERIRNLVEDPPAFDIERVDDGEGF